MSDSASIHVPVLADEVLTWIDPQVGQTIVDGTLGGGGHTRLLAERVGSTGHVISLDRDPRAIECASERLGKCPVTAVESNFSELPEVLEQLKIASVDAVLLDLGLSSDQLRDEERGFSFTSTGTLDLRFNPEEGTPAWQLLDRMGEQHLADLIYQYGEERFSRRIARRIVARRKESPVRTAIELAELVRSCVPRSAKSRIHPATKTFQALRIAVNQELESLEQALQRLPDCLRTDGRLAIISFHSLEDRRVKHAFREDTRMEVLTKRPILPSDREVEQNPRSRSSRLRVARRMTT
jgi:16S rRNA (cytosine1402-N4)-methyltransferase